MAASMVKMPVHFLKLLCCLFTLTLLTDGSLSVQDQDLTQLFKEFMLKYNKSYSGNATEYSKRFSVFKANIENANHLNKDYLYNGKSAVHGMNKFSDLSPQEFKDLYLSSYRPSQALRFKSFSLQANPLNTTGLPDKVDWRTKGVVTSIKNQESCGACWAFSVAEVMESMLSIQYGSSLNTLSVQQLIDCDVNDHGCEGGDICSCTRWAKRNGVVESSKYPLTDHTDSCKYLPSSVRRFLVRDYNCKRYVNHEHDILSLLTKGPVAVAVDAKTWHSYVQGIIQYHCPAFVSHAVAIVGYDLTGDVPYYIARNSWGSDFGDNGYLYIKVGDNLCGIASEVVSMDTVRPTD